MRKRNHAAIYERGVEYLYDITVEEDHSFIVEGMISHNCTFEFENEELQTAAEAFGHPQIGVEGTEPTGEGEFTLYPEKSLPAQYLKSSHDYSSTQVNLPEPFASEIIKLAAAIPDEEIDPDEGREDKPHVTVLFGLHDENPDGVRELLKDEPPVALWFGETSIFPASETGQNYDVVKIDIHSPALHWLHTKLADLEHTDTHPEYQPHATIAYVRAGEGMKYSGPNPLTGSAVAIDKIIFSDKERDKTEIYLNGAFKGDWDESLHPRDEIGRFTTSGGGGDTEYVHDERQPTLFGDEDFVQKTFDTEQKLNSLDTSTPSDESIGGVTEVYRIEDENGNTIAAMRPFSGLPGRCRDEIEPYTEIERTRAAYLVNRELGLVNGEGLVDMPVSVIRGEGSDRFELQEWREADGNEYGDNTDDDERRAAALFDAIVGNTDRHNGNVLWDNGHLIAIDHGLTFPDKEPGSNYNDWAHNRLIEWRQDNDTLNLDSKEFDMLRGLVGRRDWVDNELIPLIGREAVGLMWDRVDKMIETGAVLEPKEFS